MAEFDCKYHIAHEQQLTRHEGDIKEIKSELTDLKISQTEVNSKFVSFMESMSKLPEILESMKEAINGTGYEIKDMKQDIEEIKASQSKNDERINNEVDQIKDKVQKVDEKDKISLLEFVKTNLWKIIGLLSLVAYATYATIK